MYVDLCKVAFCTSLLENVFAMGTLGQDGSFLALGLGNLFFS